MWFYLSTCSLLYHFQIFIITFFESIIYFPATNIDHNFLFVEIRQTLPQNPKCQSALCLSKMDLEICNSMVFNNVPPLTLQIYILCFSLKKY